MKLMSLCQNSPPSSNLSPKQRAVLKRPEPGGQPPGFFMG
jgi:hypothetical protein